MTVPVVRADGRTEHVRVGTAYRQGDGFVLRLGELTVGAAPAEAPRPTERAQRPPPPGAAVFPPYGRAKGQPIHGATKEDLEYYAAGARRSLADPSKSRWHDKDRALLAAIEGELMRQQGGVPPMTGPAADDEIPPPSDEDIPF